MIDVSEYSKAFDEFRGVNEKLWLDVNGRLALFKKTQVRENGIHTNAHFSELFVSEMCKVLDFPCADVEIAKRDNEIGCVSYSFLEDGDELIDFNALIQNIRPNFDSKKLVVKKSKEPYSIPLMIEALEKVCSNPQDFEDTKKHLLQSCLIDSVIEHYDRNPSNISIIKNGPNIKLAPMFDNGTSLSVSLPADVADYYLSSEGGLKELRERCLSKVGTEKRYINYDTLEDYIFNNYYSYVNDFIENVSQKLTPEKIEEILSSKEYDGLEDRYKQLIQRKIERNISNLKEKAKVHEQKFEIENAMQDANPMEALNSMVANGKLIDCIPEFQDCINCTQKSDWHIYPVEQYVFKGIEGIHNIENIANEAQINLPKLSDKDKQLLSWTMMFHDLGKPGVRKEKIDKQTGEIKDTFYNHGKASLALAKPIMERMQFYPIDQEKILKLIEFHDRLELKTEKAVRKLIFDENGIGEENVPLFIALKLAENYAKNPEKMQQGLEDIGEFSKIAEKVIERENDLVDKLPITGKQIKKLGIDGIDIGTVQKKLAYELGNNPDISKNDLMRMAQITAKDIRMQRKEEEEKSKRLRQKTVPGASIDLEAQNQMKAVEQRKITLAEIKEAVEMEKASMEY